MQVAQRLPRMVRLSRPSIAANCEVAGMLAEQTGAPADVVASLAYLSERWDGKGPLRRAAGGGDPAVDADRARRDRHGIAAPPGW